MTTASSKDLKVVEGNTLMVKAPRSFVNQILLYEIPGGRDVHLFIPVYCRMAFKKMTEINVVGGCAEISATMMLSFYTGGIDSCTVDKITREMELELNQQTFHSLNPLSLHPADRLGKLHCTHDEKNKLMSFRWRSKFSMDLSCEHVFISPFSLVQLEMRVTLRSMRWIYDNVGIHVHFNIMDLPNKDTLFSLRQSDFGEYGVAINTARADFPNKLEELGIFEGYDQETQPIKQVMEMVSDVEIRPPVRSSELISWQNIVFKFDLYKYPGTTLLMFFLPVLILSIINLAIYFQANELTGKIASIATLMVAYTAFLPTVRQLLPNTPQITAMDLILVVLLCNSLLTLLRVFLDYEQGINFVFDWRSDPCYLISVASLISISLIVIIVTFLHKCKWEKAYKNRQQSKLVKFSDGSDGSNKECERYYLWMGGFKPLNPADQQQFYRPLATDPVMHISSIAQSAMSGARTKIK